MGQVLRIQTNQRVPADAVLLRTSEPSGVVYLRTDQALSPCTARPTAWHTLLHGTVHGIVHGVVL